MASADYDDKPEEAYQYDLDEWTIICQYCLRPNSATRPPVYNEVNCGCSELGTYAAGIAPAPQPNAQILKPKIAVYGQIAYTHQDATPGYVSSYTQTSTPHEELFVHESSNNFNIEFNDGYPRYDIRAAKDQTYSVQSYSWPLRAWLKENESSYVLSTTPRHSPLAHRSSSMKAKNGSKRGKSSVHSSAGSMELGPKGWGPDPFTKTGAWTTERYQEANEHPLSMSGINDFVEK